MRKHATNRRIPMDDISQARPETLQADTRAETPQMHTNEVDELAARLVAGRYGELACLRALAAVNKRRPALEREFQVLSGQASVPRVQASHGVSVREEEDSGAPPSRRSAQAEIIGTEMQSLSRARRVSNIASSFRHALESILGSARPLPGQLPALRQSAGTLPRSRACRRTYAASCWAPAAR